MNESRYPLAITIVKFSDDVHLILLKSHFDVCLECQVTVLEAGLEKTCMQRVLIFEKKVYTSWIRTHDLLNASQHWVILLWFSIECYSSFFRFFVFNPLQNASWSLHYIAVTNLKQEDDRFKVLGSWYVDLSSPSRVIGMTNGQVFSFVYIDDLMQSCQGWYPLEYLQV